ncbi:MAG: Fe-S oxidoreductase, radical superfamily [Gemmatimonadetes bacterium]|nr:Fe-S oxidoreductase, radical superfamily [Gemmatimonadota bacterium]
MPPVSPTRILLESSSHCQLRCPSCPTATGAIDAAIGRGFLTARNFEHLLTHNPQLREVELSNYGEILLNPELSAILEIAHRRGVIVRADNGVNLNSAPEAALEAIVRFGLRSMTCSIDGASPETYATYRVRGSFDRVIANVKRINALKALHASPYPVLLWQFVVFGHNEHELGAARARAAELGMTFHPKLSWDSSFSPVRDRARVTAELGAATREEFRDAKGTTYMSKICHQLWDSPQVNWDGRMLGCCRNFWGDFGANAFDVGVAAAANSEKMRHARRMLVGKAPARDDIPCSSCEIYHARAESSDWVERPATSFRKRARLAMRTLGRTLGRTLLGVSGGRMGPRTVAP